MKRKILLLLALVLTFALCFSVTSCGDDDEKTISSVKYVSGSTATEYNVGATPDFSGLQLLVTYSDGSTETIGASDLEIGTIDTSAEGTKKLTVKYGDFTVEVKITVKKPAATLTGIQIVAGSAETTVKLGATYSTANLQVEGVYNDGTTSLLNNADLEITIPDTSSIGEKKLTVKYKGYEASLTVNVTGITSMNVIANSIDREIYIGSTLNTSDLKVLVTYSNGETKTIEAVNLTIGTIDSSSIGEKQLTIVYDGFTYQYPINVYGPTKLELNSGTFDTKVLVGGKLNLSGISAKVTFSNDTVKTVYLADLKITDINTATAGKQKLTVEYGAAKAEAEINVVGVKEMTVIGVKNEILVGEALDTSGISLSVTYTDNTTALITSGIKTSSIDSTTVGDKKLTVTYLDKTIDYNVKVLGINSLSLSGVPNKINVGEAHDLSEMTAELVYSATKRVPVELSKLAITPINVDLPGEQTFKVVYTDAILGEITATVQVLVVGVKDISVTSYPKYTKAGQDVDVSAVKIKVEYTDGTHETDVLPTKVSADKDTGVITVTYTEKGITKTASATSAITSPVGIKVLGVPVSYKSDSDVTLSDVAPNMQVLLYYPAESGLSDDPVTDGYTTNFNEVKAQFKEENATINLVITYGAFTKTITIETTEPSLDSIEITTYDKTVAINKGYNKASVSVIAVYSNGRTEEITTADISDIVTTAAGVQTLTVEYEGKTATAEVKVLPVASIKYVSGLASKLNIGEDLDTSTVKVNVIYSDGTDEIIDENVTVGITVTGYDKTKAGDQTVTITCLGASATTTVHAKAIKSISIVGGYDAYVKVGTAINTANVKINVTYTDGEIVENVTPTEVSANNQTGDITATYTERGVTQTDTKENAVVILQITGMVASGLAEKIDIGNDLNTTNLKVTVTYSGGGYTETEVVTTGIEISGFDKNTAGEQALTVSVPSLSTTVKATNLTVVVRKITSIAIVSGSYDSFVREGVDYSTARVEIEIIYSNGDKVSGLCSKFGATVTLTANEDLSVSFKATLGDLVSPTVNVTTVYKVDSVDALNGTVPSVLFAGECIPLNKIALTVYYSENGNIVPHLIYLNNKNLILIGSGSDFDSESGTWGSSGEKMITLKFIDKWSAIARVMIRGVESVELVQGTVAPTVPVGKELETNEAQFKVVYTDGSYTYIAANDPNIKWDFSAFSTATAGTTTIKVTYKLKDGETNTEVIAKHTATITINVVTVVSGDESIIFGVELPKNITARDSYKTNFKDSDNVYVVGDDNKFFFRLTLLTLGTDGVPTNTTSYTSISQVYLLDASNLDAEGTLVGEEYVVINESDNSFDFTDAAVGKYFRIVSAPQNAASNKKSLVVKVENAYNIYDVKELNLITNADDDMDGDNLQLYMENGEEYGQLVAVKKFLAKNNIAYVNVSGIVLHSNMNITENDLPEEYFFEYTKDGVKKKGLLDYFAVYNRNISNPGESFTIFGNYYSIYSYNLPCVVEKGFANNDNAFSDSELILIRGRNNEAIKADTTNKHKIFKGSVIDTGFRDNDPNSNDQSASARHMLGLVGLKFRKCDGLVLNTNVEAFYISLFADWDNLDLTIENSKIYNSWQGHLFIFNENDIAANEDEMPGEYYQNIKVNIKNSLMGKCGGPVILSQQRDGGYNKNLYSGATVNIDEASELYSYVTGQEAWFVAVGATADAANVMLLDNPIRSASGGMAHITSDEKIQGVETMNLIMLTMNSGFTTGGGSNYDKLNDTLSIGGNNVLDLGASGMTGNPLTQQPMELKNNFEVDVMLSAGATYQHPIFQTSTVLPTTSILGTDINPTFVANPLENTVVNTLGEALANGIRGQVSEYPDGIPEKDAALAQADAIEKAWMTGDYISLYFGGLAVTLEYYHPTPAN